jgi:hypothetical protein
MREDFSSDCFSVDLAGANATLCCYRLASRVKPTKDALSFLFDCDDVALPALKLDPDTELGRVVSADVEVRRRAVLHDVERSRDDRF